MSSHQLPASGPVVPDSLVSGIEDSISQLYLPDASTTDTAPVVQSTIRSIHSLLRSSSASALLSPSSSSSSSLTDGLVSALGALFQALLLSRQYERCLALLSLLPHTPSSSPSSSALVDLRADLLRRLVLGLSQSAALPLLTRLPFGSSLERVTHILFQQAHNSDLNLADPSSSSSSPPNFYDVLYSFLLFHGLHRHIARSQAAYALRIQSEGDLSEPPVLSLYIHALQRVHNALSLLPDPVVSVPLPSGQGAVVLGHSHVEQRLQAALAQADLLSASPSPPLSLTSSPSLSLIPPLLHADLFDRAVSLASSLPDPLDRHRALESVLSHLVTLLAREATSGEQAEFHVEDHRVPAADAAGYFPPPTPSPSLHCLRALLARFDDASLRLRTFALAALLASPRALTVPQWLLSHRPIAVAYSAGGDLSGEGVGSEGLGGRVEVDAFAAVGRTLLKANRLDLAVEAAVKWLEDRGSRAEAEREGGLMRAGKRLKAEDAGVEWNVLEDLVLRLEQAKKVTGMDPKATQLVSGLHSTLMKALPV